MSPYRGREPVTDDEPIPDFRDMSKGPPPTRAERVLQAILLSGLAAFVALPLSPFAPLAGPALAVLSSLGVIAVDHVRERRKSRS